MSGGLRVSASAEALATVREHFEASVTASERFFEGASEAVVRCAAAMADRFFDGGRLLVFGAGSACTDAQHNAVEYVHPALPGCRALPALSLGNDGSAVTGILLGPDPASVFAHQIGALGRARDIALAFGEAPTSPVIRRGLEAAAAKGMLTVAVLIGRGEAGLADHLFTIDVTDPMAAQEVQLALYHILWELVHIILNHRGIPRTSVEDGA